MLADAFCESRNYRELLQRTDFRFVVGGRRTGKSALFDKVAEALACDKDILLLTERPSEKKVAAWGALTTVRVSLLVERQERSGVHARVRVPAIDAAEVPARNAGFSGEASRFRAAWRSIPSSVGTRSPCSQVVRRNRDA